MISRTSRFKSAVYGKWDPIQLHHYEDVYAGLSNLGRAVALVGYDHSGHVEMLGYADFWNRTLRWFDYYLRGVGEAAVLPASATEARDAGAHAP